MGVKVKTKQEWGREIIIAAKKKKAWTDTYVRWWYDS